MRIKSWMVRSPAEPMVLEERDESPHAGEVLVEVAGCGVCRTDLEFYYEGIPTRRPFPLTLGHEISGRVVEAGEGAEPWIGRHVIVPAVIPCGVCEACRAERGPVCPHQVFPGCDVHGGFATHLCVPARGLCPVPDLSDPTQNPLGLDLASLAVVADAIATPYQAILRSGLEPGDLAVFVGAGGLGGFGVQIAAERGAVVVAVDVDPRRLDRLPSHGAALVLRADELDFRELRRRVRELARHQAIPTWRHRIFETSGTPEGQATAFGLVGHGGYLAVVGYTPAKVQVRLSNLMALDAAACGNWGCLPEHYPAALGLALSGKVAIAPFVERRPLDAINETFEELRIGRIAKRVILVPDG